MENEIIFWNVDTQQDFMNKNGKLYVQDAEEIYENLKKITEISKEENIKVVNTCDWHRECDEEISDKPDFKITFPEHCMVGSFGAEFIPEVYPKNKDDNYYIVDTDNAPIDEGAFNRARNIIIHKNKFDVFEGNSRTEEVLKLLNPKIVVVYGVALSFCVKYAVLGLVKRGYKVVLLLDCCKDLPGMDIDCFAKELEHYEDFIEPTTINSLLEVNEND